MENRRRRPVMACVTVEGSGTCHDAERDGAAGVDVPDEDDVGVPSRKVLDDIVWDRETSSCRSSEGERGTSKFVLMDGGVHWSKRWPDK